MMKLLLRFSGYLRNHMAKRQAIEERADDVEHWRRDPLAHPAIKAMDERERADLPFSALRD
ncbi:hypothetical protein [Chelativorans sp. YIM 93263]|uniref:hypothetical protein n=1 Tax=Chelativorans sp. YIM 93263 TaxID=2906648 RepID=UPI0023783117|nr:hypothetical protein [Chelativorans sp. YIM 93263]